MIFNVIPTLKFKKEAKRLIRKFPSLKTELQELEKKITENPLIGTPLGNNTFKIRLAIKSKASRKRGGARIITYILVREKEIYLLTIYDKSEISCIDDNSLKSLIEDIHAIS